jgi:hypothetical protein
MTSRISIVALAGVPGSSFIPSTGAAQTSTAVACNDAPVVPCCEGLSAGISNAVTDPRVSALDPGPNPSVPYLNCAAQ